MSFVSSVRKGFRNLWLVGLSAIAVVSVAIAAVPGFPFTEDFTSNALEDMTLTTADWGDTSPGTLQFGFANALTAMTLTRSPLGGAGEDQLTTRDVVLADVDRDGDPDVVVGNEGPIVNNQSVGAANLIYFNDGGTFNTPGVTLGTDTRRTRGLAVGDLDRDGDLDIVAGNFQQPVVYYLNNGSGGFTDGTIAATRAGNTWRVHLADVEGDGDLDIIESMSGDRNFLYINRTMEDAGVLSFETPTPITNENFVTRSLALGDIDNDGDTDIVAGDQNGVGNHVYTWSGSSFQAQGVAHPNGNTTFAVELADVNGDGYLDLIEGNAAIPTQIYLNQGAGNPGLFSNPIVLADSNAAHVTVSLVVRDIDRDGDLDIIEGNNGAWDDDNNANTPLVAQPIRMFLNNGNGTFANGTNYQPPAIQKVYGSDAADVNGDGQLDVVTSHSTNNPGGPDALAGNALYLNGGNPNGASTRQLDSLAQSLEVDGADDPINTAQVSLTLAQAAPLANVQFFVSNNNGNRFMPVVPAIAGVTAGVPARFPDGTQRQLKWKIVARTGSPNAAQLAAIDQVDIADNGRPSFNNVGPLNEIEGQPMSANATLADYFTDPDGHALTYQLSGLPAGSGVTFDSRTGQLGGVLTNADAQASPIALSATVFDGADTRNGNITLNVASAVNDPPTANDDGPYVVDEGGTIASAFNVLDNDTDPENDTLSAVLVDPPLNSAQFELKPDGTFDYTHDGGETTSDSFTYRADDGNGQSGVATVTISITPMNDAPVISLTGLDPVNVTVGDAYNDAGATALDAEDGDITANIVVGGDTVDTNTAGTYVITYDVTDSGGAAAVQVTRTVNVVTDNAPVITLLGSSPVNVTVGGSYTDAGATAMDTEDGDITANIVVGGDTVDTNTVGTYVITYNVTDSNGNAAAEVTRTVNVIADNVPVITLVGNDPVNLTTGDSYTDAGATAMDTEDGDITADIVVGGDTVNTAMAGTYVITYNVTDSNGNAAVEVTRTVIVTNPPPTQPPPSGGGGGGLFGLWESLGLLFAGLLAYRRRRADSRIG